MTDVRRKRMVYMSDQEWAALKGSAAVQKVSASEVVRRAITLSGFGRATPSDPTILRDAVTAVVTRPAAQRFDDGRSGFGHSSPAPKTGRRR